MKEIKSFILIGIINTLVGLSCIYSLFNGCGLNYWYATLIGNGVGMVVSYLLNKKFTFKHKGDSGKSFMRFCLIVLFCYFISYRLGQYSADLFGFTFSNYSNLKGDFAILVGSGLYTIFNYFGQKFLVFRKVSNASP